MIDTADTPNQDLVQDDDCTEDALETVQVNDAERLAEQKRMVEALLFAATTPLSVEQIQARLPGAADVLGILKDLEEEFTGRGFNLVNRAGEYRFLTAPDLSFLLRDERDQIRKLSRAAMETLAIIAYHQPVTRAEIEELRGVSLSRGTLDVILEAGWIRPRGRKQVPGRPVLYATSSNFLAHFGLDAIEDLPGLAELKAAGLMEPIDDALQRMLAQGQEKMQKSQDAGNDRDGDDAAEGQHELL